MRYFAAFLLCTIALALAEDTKPPAQEAPKPKVFEATLGNVTDTQTIFSFKAGALVKMDPKDIVTGDWDLVMDLPHYIATNSQDFMPRLKEHKGGIADMGEKPLEEVKEPAKDGYVAKLLPIELKEKHSYCIKDKVGKVVGKIHVKKFDKETAKLNFLWAKFD